jgi:hypothetical protein
LAQNKQEVRGKKRGQERRRGANEEGKDIKN